MAQEYEQLLLKNQNFTKFIVDHNGRVVARLEPTADMQKVEDCIKSLL